MILRREKLRKDPAVLSALSSAWRRLSRLREAASEGGESLDRASYGAMARKLYLLITLMSTSSSRRRSNDTEYIDAAAIHAEIDADWEEDAAGKDHMSRDDFDRCLFEVYIRSYTR